MKLAIGTDHAGLELKARLVKHLEQRGIEVEDLGAHEFEPEDDYPDYAQAVAETVAGGSCDRGLLVCGSGIGMSIAANRVPGARAALCLNEFMARLARQHNNANIIVVAGRVTAPEHVISIVNTWLDTEFSGDDRHVRRINKLEHHQACR
ncbi:MAG: ribose 5-phosphate isomerase B [Candidatus Hydrogenedentes bacterium]|nr:ribose 5-phosphate isomerase B [Candidatus Hydrogenedentota bacterium]